VVRVVHEYTAQYPDPITVRAGDRVVVGADDPAFPGWRWCTGPDRRAGWVPERFLQAQGQQVVMLRDYTARELSVRAGGDRRAAPANPPMQRESHLHGSC
jgi:hypothetical protein